MIIPRHALLPPNPPILNRPLKHHPPTQRARLLPKHLLPRRLARHALVSSLRHQFLATSGDFGGAEQHVDGALAEVDADGVGVAQDGEVAVARGFGGRVQDRGGC